jgi:hypothetical protein
MLLAQLSDLISGEEWTTGVCLGGAAPLACWLIGWLWKGRGYRRRTWPWLAIYYALTLFCAGYSIVVFRWCRESWDILWLVCSLSTLTIIVGPLVGLVLLCFAISMSRRHPAGHCQRCGYDLSGNVSGCCPECGTVVGPGSESKPRGVP